MAPQHRETMHLRQAVVIALACVGGFVDAVGYLVLFQMFTAHMSGNTIAGGVHLSAGAGGQAWHRLMPVPAFVLGVAAGRGLIGFLCVHRIRRQFAAAFAAEALLLALFLGCGATVFRDGGLRPGSSVLFYLLAALPALAMGVQNGTIRRVGGQTVRTTYITGTLTDFAEAVVDFLYARGVDGSSSERPTLSKIALPLGMWLAYFLCGVGGAFAQVHWQLPCLLLPIGCLFVLALADVVHPFSKVAEGADRVTGQPP